MAKVYPSNLPCKDTISNIISLRGRIVEWMLIGVAVALLVSMGLKSIVDVDRNWDTWAYHLPFAARLWGMVTPEDFIFDSYFQPRFEGFALLGEFLQGFFWYIFKRPEAANLLSFSSLVIYLYFMKAYFNVPLYLSTIAILAVPLIQVHATSSYIDLPGGIAVAVLIMMTYFLYVRTDEFRRRDLFIIFISAACAANMRLQLVPIVFIILCFAVYKVVLRCYVNIETEDTKKKKVFWKLILICIMLVIVFATPIKNTVLFGNPFYPVYVKIGSTILNHTENPPPEPEIPGIKASRLKLWLYSIFEIIPRPFYRGDWSIDQKLPEGIAGDRFGGYFGAYVLFNFVLFMYLIYRNWTRETKIAAFVIIFMSVVTALMPNAPRLRYYMFWMIVLVSINLYLVCHYSRRRSLFGLNPSNMAFVAGLALIIVVISTNTKYVRPIFYSFDRFIERKVDYGLLHQIRAGDTACMQVRQKQFLFLYSSLFHPPLNYSIKFGKTTEDCGTWKVIVEK